MFATYDTETTNKWDFKAPWNDPIQPDLVQLGYMIQDINRKTIKEVDVVVDTRSFPTFNLSDEAAAVHGITLERMATEGKDPKSVAKELVEDFMNVNFSIAHNNQFDIQVLNLFLYRCGYAPNLFDNMKNLCTMKPLTNVLKIPSARGGYKWPTLQEAYKALVDRKGFSGAHDAMVDVRACNEVFWKAYDAKIVPAYTEVQEFIHANRG